MLTIDKIYDASKVLKEVALQTEIIQAQKINPESEVYLKTENLQVTGSFKVRGAYYKIHNLTAEEKARGVIACSAGNHAQGVALAAAKGNIDAVICIPSGAPISKVEATRRYGANVELVDGVYDDAYRRACEIQAETGRVFIHPFNDEDIIAGQGTIGLEIVNQMPDVDAVLVPIGGGGLISGVAFAIKSLFPKCKVYGAQAEGAPSMLGSLKSGAPVELPSVSTVADGIAVKKPGDITFQMVHDYVDEVVTVSEDEIATAILALIEHQKLIAEGAGAVTVAAAMFNKVDIRGMKTVCLISGGNIDVNILSRVITRGLVKEGRSASLTLSLTDKPGELLKVSSIISATGANILGVNHNRSALGTAITACELQVSMETRDHEHVAEIRRALTEAGFQIVH
ncbi:MAG: threonine ammonia-lyase [Oscillospiraceae bacterium]|jgi:threonine dehydratase|nr:threonine ammonia-lyase [Oscillospiraceae bacterium]